MAQGNYVTLPGGNGPNPFKGISESLSDLSKMYINKSNVDREEALQRDKLAEDQRRWEKSEARLDTKDTLAETERGRKELARKASWDFTPTFTLENYDAFLPEARKGFELLQGNKDREQAHVLKYLSTPGDPNALPVESALKDSANAYRKSLEVIGTARPDQINELVRQRVLKLGEIRGMADAAQTDEDKQALLAKTVEELYDKPLQKHQQGISQGLGLTLEQKKQILLDPNMIPEDMRNSLSYQEYASIVEPRLTGRTEASIRESEAARIAGLRAQRKDEIDAADKYLKRANTGYYSGSSKSGGSSGGTKGAINSFEKLSEIKERVKSWFPDDDPEKVMAGYEHLLTKGIKPELAAAGIEYAIENNLVFDDFPDIDSDNFIKMQSMAELMSQKQGGTGGSYGRKFIKANKADFSYNNIPNARTVNQILAQELQSRIPTRGNVPVSENFSRDLLDYIAANPLNTTPEFKDVTKGKPKVKGKPKSDDPPVPKSTLVDKDIAKLETSLNDLRSQAGKARTRTKRRDITREIQQVRKALSLKEEAKAEINHPLSKTILNVQQGRDRIKELMKQTYGATKAERKRLNQEIQQLQVRMAHLR